MTFADLQQADLQQRAPARQRIVALDVLRGFALCGILLANVKPIAGRGAGLAAEIPVTAAGNLLHLLVDQRFFPIFSVLFGVGFALLLEKASRRLMLLRRLLALLAVGLLHFSLLWKGDVLSVYAGFGLLVLLPSTWLPRRVVAIAAGLLIVVSVTLLGGWYSLVPGLLLLGSALVRYGLIARITRTPVTVFLIFVAAALVATVVQVRGDGPIAYPTAGLLTAGVYVTGISILLRTRLASALTAVFAPLGRMALTNYLTATVLVLTITGLLGGADRWPVGGVVACAAAILLVQWIWSVLWLRHFRQGPLEWLWRWVTWWQRPPLHRTPE